MLRLSTLMTCLAAAGLLACPPSTIPDTDDNPTAVDLPRLPPDLEVMDDLNVGTGDKLDWKTFTAFDAGKGKITAIVGDPFGGPHGLVGEIGVYARTGPPAIVKKAITPSEHTYELEFDVEADETYLLQVSADKGKAPYKLTFGVTVPPKDPCEDVTCEGEDEECIDGKCVAPEPPDDVCDPKCPRGRVCVEGTCEPYCGGSCPRGQICSWARNECVRDPCFGKKCASGETCRGGRCIAPKPAGCSPKCASDEECKGSTCVKKATDGPPPADDGPVRGKIIQLIPRGDKTELVLDRGSKHGVANGATGRIDGVSGQFKITEVYTFRSKAVISVDDKVIGAARSVTINR